MDKQAIISKTIEYVQATLKDAEGGHDWWHINRVWNLSKRIASSENVDLFIVEIGALLHDIADAKFYDGDETIGPKKAMEFLSSLHVDDSTIQHVVKIIENISYKVQLEGQQFKSLELDVIQDADRLDAIGAIGIARAFNYGGFKNRAFYDPNIQPQLNMSKEEYKKSSAPTINHFYEKLLLLKDLMNTSTGKRMAEHRHQYMELFLNEFYQEWEGKL